MKAWWIKEIWGGGSSVLMGKMDLNDTQVIPIMS